MSDVLLGVYIAGLVSVDIIYGSPFGKYREQWKISNTCMLLECFYVFCRFLLKLDAKVIAHYVIS